MAEAGGRQPTTETLATLYIGKLRLERRNGAPKIFDRAYVQGKLIVRTTGEQTLSAATKVATDWYLELRDRMRRGERMHGRSFAHCAGAFLEHAELLREVSDGQRKNYREKWSLLKDHFDGVKVTDVDTKVLLELREKRSRKDILGFEAITKLHKVRVQDFGPDEHGFSGSSTTEMPNRINRFNNVLDRWVFEPDRAPLSKNNSSGLPTPRLPLGEEIGDPHDLDAAEAAHPEQVHVPSLE